jgi:superfamily II DNA or RNA helicase
MQEIDTLNWSTPKQVNTRNGPCLVKTAPPSEGFWNLYREHKEALQSAGFSISKFGGEWAVNWWMRGTEFLYPHIVEDIQSESLEPLPLLPLGNETGFKSWQPPLVQTIVAAMKEYQCSLNGCGTGVGKTFITLGAQRERERRLLIVCPKVIVPQWERACYAMGVKYVGVYGWEWMKTGKTPWGKWDKDSGKGKKKGKTDFRWWLPDDVDVVFDECHRAKAMDTQNAAMVISAKDQGVRMFLLSATIANDPTKMRATGYALGLHNDGQDYYKWMARHGVVRKQFIVGVGGKMTYDGVGSMDSEDEARPSRRRISILKFEGGERHLKAIHNSIFPRKGCRLVAEDIADFPETQIIAEPYELEEAGEIRAAYEEMADNIADIEGDRDMEGAQRQANILVEILRARQKVELLKIPLMISLTSDAEENGMSIIIAVNFKETMAQLCKALKIKAMIAGISTGRAISPGYSMDKRQQAMDDFQSNKINKIIGITAAMREGLDLHDVHGGHPRLSLISPPQSADQLKQVLGRPHRAGGLTKSVQRILYAAGTIEEQVCEGLATKLDQLDLIMDGDLSAGMFPDGYSDLRPDEEEQGALL